MALVSGRRSTLNPNAPLFIPAALKQVEDFSPEWWQLVTTSPWFRDYWVNEHQGADGFYDNGENDNDSDMDVADLLPESFDFGAMEDFFASDATEFDSGFDGSLYYPSSEAGLVSDSGAVSFLKSLEGRSPRSAGEPAKYSGKPAKWVNPRCTPRNIHQPR